MLRRRDDDAHDDSKTMQLFAITASARRLAELSHSVSITLRSPDGSLDVSYIYRRTRTSTKAVDGCASDVETPFQRTRGCSLATLIRRSRATHAEVVIMM